LGVHLEKKTGRHINNVETKERKETNRLMVALLLHHLLLCHLLSSPFYLETVKRPQQHVISKACQSTSLGCRTLSVKKQNFLYRAETLLHKQMKEEKKLALTTISNRFHKALSKSLDIHFREASVVDLAEKRTKTHSWHSHR
jgi:hypothetical protein